MAQFQEHNIQMLREWAPLTDLFNILPSKQKNGIFSQDIHLTSVDVLPEFLALGTNVGIIYWYDRKLKDLQRLRCEYPNSPITCVKTISTVDYMVACGDTAGNISIFQIPKCHPDSVPDNLKPRNKLIERYTVTDMHKTAVTAIEWSKNGMKLFTGDGNGCVVYIEIDFYMHICKSVEILNETYEVVQLSYIQQHLLVSTTYRSIICKKLDKWKVSQVGKKDRKVLGKFGGIMYQNGYKLSDICLYCTRPGLRIWNADTEGEVQKTLLFKELLCKECPEIPIINPMSKNLRQLKPHKEPCFGVLLLFSEKLLVTYSNDVVYILDPQQMTILSTINHLRSILWVATHKDEIFILEEARSLIRIAYKPEAEHCSSSASTNSTFFPITSSFKDLTTKLQTSSIISAIPPLLEHTFLNDVNIHTDENLVINAEEAKESPNITVNMDSIIQKKFDDIGRMQFENEILFKKNKNHKKRSNMSASVSSISSNSSEEKEMSYTRPTVMNLSTLGVLPDLRSPESIQNDIDYKEKILADVLNLDKIKIPSDKPDGEDIVSNLSSYCDEYDKNNMDISSIKDIPKLDEMEKRKEYHFDQMKIVPGVNYLKYNKTQPTQNRATNSILNAPVMNIPNDWKLSNIQLGDKKERQASDCSSLSDWEIV